jgi:hypothetical protein
MVEINDLDRSCDIQKKEGRNYADFVNSYYCIFMCEIRQRIRSYFHARRHPDCMLLRALVFKFAHFLPRERLPQ